MSVAIDSTPSTFNAVYRPIEFEVSSNKTTALTETACSVADSGGKAQFTKSSHGFVVGDIIDSRSNNSWIRC